MAAPPSNSADVSEEKVLLFMSMTGASDAVTARSYLEMARGSIEEAVGLFYDIGGVTPSAQARMAPRDDCTVPRCITGNADSHNLVEPVDSDRVPEQPLGTVPSEESVRSALPAYAECLLNDRMSIKANLHGGEADMASLTVNTLISHGEPADEGDRAFTALYAPPPYRSNLPFQEARASALEMQKLLLVNMQCPEEFASHELNRDVWRDEGLGDLIQAHFLFWQVTTGTTDGTWFKDTYRVNRLPHIGVIDPRTGRQLKLWDSRRFKTAICATSELLEFLDEEEARRAAQSARLSSTFSAARKTESSPTSGSKRTCSDMEGEENKVLKRQRSPTSTENEPQAVNSSAAERSAEKEGTVIGRAAHGESLAPINLMLKQLEAERCRNRAKGRAKSSSSNENPFCNENSRSSS